MISVIRFFLLIEAHYMTSSVVRLTHLTGVRFNPFMNLGVLHGNNSKTDVIACHKESDGYPKDLYFGSVFRGGFEKRNLHSLGKLDRLIHVFSRLLSTYAYTTTDWVAKGAVTPASDQGRSGTCNVFGVVALAESYHFIKTGELLKLSVQHVIDGTTNSCHYSFLEALRFIIRNGLPLWDDYPYGGNLSPKTHIKLLAIRGWANVDTKNVDKLLQALPKGPILVGFEISLEFDTYTKGIIRTLRPLKKKGGGVQTCGFKPFLRVQF